MIAIISDVHGNYPALMAVLKEIDELGCSTIISLGDVSGYYCMVNECIDEFRRRNIVNIMGNHDSYLLGYGCCPRSFTVNKCIDYQKKIISNENINYLKRSVEKIDNAIFSARHGGWSNPIDEYVTDFDFSLAEHFFGNIFCSGHTHVQKLVKNNTKIYFNPGSVGQPRDNINLAGYATIDDNGSVKLYRIKYDIDAIAAKMKSEGFENRVFECLFKGTKIGG